MPEIHGESKTKLYGVWLSMKRRCDLETSKSYNNYGGKGISVCEEWINSYISFRDWSLENGYREGLEIDRIDTYGNYEPSNCRWITRLVNARNKKSTIFIEIDGETKTLQEWSEEKGFSPKTIRDRYKKGIGFDELFKPTIVHKPPKSKPKVFVDINGVSKSLREWSEYSGINLKTIEFRYYQKGIKDEKLIEKPKQRS